MKSLRVCSYALFTTFLFSAATQAADDAVTTRWFAIDQAVVGIRPAYEQDSKGATTTNQLQYHDAFEGRFFFDADHAFSLNFGGGAGDGFAGGWGNTAIGAAPASTNSYLKLLYLDAKPISAVELEWGGIGIERGASTASSSYSNDGFMAGERLYLRSPNQLFFDTVAVTYGNLAEIMHPDVWDRAHTLFENNYQQYLVLKNLSKRFTASTDYTVLAGARTFREALRGNIAELRFADQFNIDLYERTNRTAAGGGNISLSKSLTKGLGLTAGYAAIDRNYGDLNDDAFFHGRRAYLAATLHLPYGFAISPMFDHGVGNSYDLPNNTHFHLAFTYDLLESLRR